MYPKISHQKGMHPIANKNNITPLDSLPRRIFLDSSTIQDLHSYGGFIWDGERIPIEARIWSVPQGVENLEALKDIILVDQRAMFEFALSDNSLSEVRGKRDSSYLQWGYDLFDHWLSCLELYQSDPIKGKNVQLASKLNGKHFGYLAEKDKRLIKDAILLECGAFMTMDHRLSKNGHHLEKNFGIKILTPVQFWEMLLPWAALFV